MKKSFLICESVFALLFFAGAVFILIKVIM